MNKRILPFAVLTAILSNVSDTTAAGFKLAEYSATGLGRAYAGESAMADNASTQARNAAMLSYLSGTNFSTGGVYVMPNVDIIGDISISSALLGTDSLVIDSDAADIAGNALVPNFYFSQQVNDKLTWGIGINSHYGLATELDDSHAAAIFGNETSIKTAEFNPNIAYKITDNISIGGGIRIVYGEGSIAATTPAWIDDLKAVLSESIASALPTVSSNLKSMEGDDISYGWNMGTSWQINPEHRIGFSYHSSVTLDLAGAAGGIQYTGGQDTSYEGVLPVKLPAFAELSSYHQMTERLAVHTSINWSQWSVFDELVAYFPGDEKPVGDLESDLVKEENFEDNWRFALGSTYQINDQWLLRSGIALDKTAVSDEFRSITIPDSDRLWFSTGIGYQINENLTIDGSFTYIKSKGYTPINETMDLLGLAQIDFNGETQSDVLLLGLQISYKL